MCAMFKYKKEWRRCDPLREETVVDRGILEITIVCRQRLYVQDTTASRTVTTAYDDVHLPIPEEPHSTNPYVCESERGGEM